MLNTSPQLDRIAVPQPLVDFNNVSRFFPPSTTALQGATFQISLGETVAIVGPSGSGKSTLLALLGLLDTATSGTYRILGEDVSSIGEKERTRVRREHIGFIFQAFHLIPHLTALENIEHGLNISGIKGRTARTRAIAAMEDVGLEHRMQAFTNTMSGGEQQRVAIARALAREPQLLLCDEPTGNLDTTNSRKVLDLLTSRHTESAALLIVTHDPEVAAKCSRSLHVLDGMVTEQR